MSHKTQFENYQVSQKRGLTMQEMGIWQITRLSNIYNFI